MPALAVAAFWAWRYLPTAVKRAEYAAKTATFSDSSEKLKQTIVVPTLDTPLPPGQNVIWCSSFQLVWNELRDKVIGAPLEIAGAQEIADRLNAAKTSVSDLSNDSVYAAAGWVQKGIREIIKEDMTARFASYMLPDFSKYTDGILAYSYLTARVPFKCPFRQVHKGITFTDSQGIQSQVDGFGLWFAYLEPYKNLREQIEILYARQEEQGNSREVPECAIDLCQDSQPYQVVVAKVESKGSLAETIEHITTEIEAFKRLPYYSDVRRFGGNDELMIPEMFWRIDHRFKELVGKTVANSDPPMPIVEALQTIEFRLDRSGAVLESESRFAIASAPRYFNFDHPFLVYMQKRGAERPFFVMWVDNAELLTRK